MKQNSSFARLIYTAFTLLKLKLKAFIAAGAALIFSMFFLLPLDLYLNNFTDFNVSLSNVALPLITVSIVLFLALVLILPLIFRGNALDAITLLFFGAAVFFYVQILFLNGEMVELFGGGAIYHERTLMRTINLLVFIIVVFLPLIIHKILSKGKNTKNIKWEAGVIYVSILILGMQTAGIFAAISGYDSNNVNRSHYLSYNKALELSSQENICVFIMDYLDVKYMNDALSDYPELYEQLDGFTFYENNVSVYMYTFPTITYMLTGELYNSDVSRQAYWDKAWAKRNIFDVLRENGYRSSFISSRNTVYNSFEHIKNRVNNFMETYESDIKINHFEIVKKTLAISFGRAVPYYYKDIFFMNIYSDFSNDFFFWQRESNEFPGVVGVKTDLAIYNKLKTIGLYTQNDQKTFSIIHFNSAHDGGYCYNQYDDMVESCSGDYHGAVRGSFAIINEYFRQMKELDIYDNSTIVVLADHGRNPIGQRWHDDDYPWDNVTTPTLLIKPKNERGALKKNSSAELSHTNFRASILQFAGLPYKDFGLSYFDIINGGLRQMRTHYWINWIGSSNYTLGEKYEINGDANNFSNWRYAPTDNGSEK